MATKRLIPARQKRACMKVGCGAWTDKLRRGLCIKHYQAMKGQVRYGKTTFKIAEAAGLCLPPIGASNLRHGHARTAHTTPEHNAWGNMLARCRVQKNRMFKYYGGRGIKVCDRWHEFENFLADMGLRPSAKHSIDRINNDGNYEPGNCRWATREQQSFNRSNNRWLTAHGKTLTITQWSRVLKLPKGTLHSRVKRTPPDRLDALLQERGAA